MRAVVEQPVPQPSQAKIADQVEILLSARIVAALLKRVAPQPPVLDGGTGTLDLCGEHEIAGTAGWQAAAVLAPGAAVSVAVQCLVGLHPVQHVEEALGAGCSRASDARLRPGQGGTHESGCLAAGQARHLDHRQVLQQVAGRVRSVVAPTRG